MRIGQKFISGVVAVTILTTTTPLYAAPPKSTGVTLRVDPATTLPGLPVAFLVTLPVEVIERGLNEVNAVLHVTPEAGKTFQPFFHTDDAFQGVATGSIDFFLRSLPARGMVEVQQPVSPPWGPGWFADHRLQQPGTYRLRLQILATELGMPEDLWSTEAILEVRQPEGTDAEAWQWLRTHGWIWEKWSDDFGRQLVEKFPSTAYARYGIGELTRDAGDDATTWIQKAIELSEGTWLADYYRLVQQGRRLNSCHEAASRGASQRDVRQCTIQATLDVLAKSRSIVAQTTSPALRHMAESEGRRMQESVENMKAVKD